MYQTQTIRQCLWLIAAVLVICGASVLVFTGCHNGGRKSSSPEATAMINAASEAKDNERVLSLADSLSTQQNRPYRAWILWYARWRQRMCANWRRHMHVN